MALASAGASTPFMTSTPSSAVTLTLVAAGERLGLAAAAGSAEVALAAASFAGFASLPSAITGTAAMASRSRLDHNLLNFNLNFDLNVDMDGVLSFWPVLGPCPKHGARTYSKSMNDVK